jgi:ubiquinone/menaquinone biosynthesis C-methylase UbiE
MTADRDAIFWDSAAKRYDRQTKRLAAMYDEMVRRILQELAPGDNVLDVGTGTGEIPLRICHAVSRLEAVDASREMIAVARDNAKLRGARNVTFSVHNSYNLPFRDGTFDAVIVSNLLHIVEHPADVLAEARRVLKTDGRLIAPTYVGRESVRARIFSWVLKRTGHPVYTRFTSRSLRALIERSGFDVADQALLKNILPVSFIVARKAGATPEG